jgi:hypothetical protein
VVNAIMDALGVQVSEVPVTPEKVMQALEQRYRGPVMPAFTYPPTVKVPPLAAAEPAPAPDVDPAVRP